MRLSQSCSNKVLQRDCCKKTPPPLLLRRPRCRRKACAKQEFLRAQTRALESGWLHSCRPHRFLHRQRAQQAPWQLQGHALYPGEVLCADGLHFTISRPKEYAFIILIRVDICSCSSALRITCISRFATKRCGKFGSTVCVSACERPEASSCASLTMARCGLSSPQRP